MEKKFRYFIAVPITDLESAHIGHHLRRLREFLDIKQCAAAANTEHSPSTISDMERHRKNPKFCTIQSYVKALGAEFYAFVPAGFLSADMDLTNSRLIMVQISPEELVKIKKSS